MRKVFINHTNHPSCYWSHVQREEAEQFGEVTDFPFPDIGPEWDEERVLALAKVNCEKILALQPAAVLCQGEFTYCYQLIRLLKKSGIEVLAACSKRETKVWMENGKQMKTAEFSFVQFRKY